LDSELRQASSKLEEEKRASSEVKNKLELLNQVNNLEYIKANKLQSITKEKSTHRESSQAGEELLQDLQRNLYNERSLRTSIENQLRELESQLETTRRTQVFSKRFTYIRTNNLPGFECWRPSAKFARSSEQC
jgi:DNA gyrase/topoisomerase IV subunit A